jgi:hypothetical protein
MIKDEDFWILSIFTILLAFFCWTGICRETARWKLNEKEKLERRIFLKSLNKVEKD